MIIAIDGYEANVNARVGIGRYAFELLTAIYTKQATLPVHDLKFRIYLPETPRPDMPAETDWWKYCIRTPSKLWTFFALPIALAADVPKADVVFSPTHYIPRFTSIPCVMSIMDLSYLYFPELFKKKDLFQLTRWTEYAVKHAKSICTISEFSKNDIINRYSVAASKVHLTYPGFSMEIHKKSESAEDLSKKYSFSEQYILSVGTIQPRKNYGRLIEAFSLFLNQNKQKFGEIDLVVVGKKGWLVDSILQAPAKFGIADRVKFLDFVPDDELPVLYRNA